MSCHQKEAKKHKEEKKSADEKRDENIEKLAVKVANHGKTIATMKTESKKKMKNVEDRLHNVEGYLEEMEGKLEIMERKMEGLGLAEKFRSRRQSTR
jgi:hypothetical protein